MRELPDALMAMSVYNQFIIYVIVPSKTRPGKTDKFPCDFRSGKVVNAHDQANWTDVNTAIAAAANFGSNYGVGFVLTETDPFWFLDIDDCFLDNDWSSLAKTLCGIFNGAAIEVSQSGKGLHIFGTGRPPIHRCKNENLHLEFYNSGRFAALTGLNIAGNAAIDFTHILPNIVSQYFPADPVKIVESVWTDQPCEDWRGPNDDADLIRRALQSKSASSSFGGKASFADLWNANIDALSKAYPDDVRGYNASQADAALAQHLAFWTGKNCERIRALMEKSALNRDKWSREDYLPRTILGAVSRQFEVLTDKAVEFPIEILSTPNGEKPRPKPREGSTFVNNSEQLDLFAGCVYVQDIHKVLVPGGIMLKPAQFEVAFGGYTFTLDNANEKVTRNAWEAFTQNQAYRAPRVNSTCFRPDLPDASIIHRDGLTLVNSYCEIDIPRKVGDITPFLTHLQKVLPDERDRLILLSYMAACVQHKGVKFKWAPFLQGVEGNGKTLFTLCVVKAVGERYVHFPPASEISEKFNAWLFGKILIGVEDVFVTNNKQEIFEILKPMITSEDLSKRAMQTDQIMNNVVANFMFNSNHKNGLRKTKNDRRIAPFFSAQQKESDLKRDGMTEDYFQKLYTWLRADGYAIVSELLHTWPIPDEFNPATSCQRAPTTTATFEAIEASTGSIEQEIQEAVEQGLPGFCGGWISSIQLDKLLEKLGNSRRISHSKRKEMLNDLGYVTHPSLPDGRVNNMVLPDQSKPRLFVKKDSDAYKIQTALDAAKNYEQSNNYHFQYVRN